jgi:hypothetical protein
MTQISTHFRIADIIWLAVSINPPCPKLIEFLDDVDAKELSEILGVKILPRELEGDDYREVLEKIVNRGMNGFLVHAEVPVPIMIDGPLAHMSHLVAPGVVISKWFYFECLDQEIESILAQWKDQVIKKEKIRLNSESKERGLVAMGRKFRKALRGITKRNRTA